MARPDKLEFGLLPERRMDWRTLATSYGIEHFSFFCCWSWVLFPDTLRLKQKFTVTELVPRPDLKPEPVKPKAKVRHPVVVPKLPPPVFQAAKLFVPKDIHTRKKKEEEEKAPELEAKFKSPDLAHRRARCRRGSCTRARLAARPRLRSALPYRRCRPGGLGILTD